MLQLQPPGSLHDLDGGLLYDNTMPPRPPAPIPTHGRAKQCPHPHGTA